MTTETRYDFDDGKYTVVHDRGRLRALRYGEEWRDLTGDNLVYWMLVEIDRLKKFPQTVLELFDGPLGFCHDPMGQEALDTMKQAIRKLENSK